MKKFSNPLNTHNQIIRSKKKFPYRLRKDFLYEKGLKVFIWLGLSTGIILTLSFSIITNNASAESSLNWRRIVLNGGQNRLNTSSQSHIQTAIPLSVAGINNMEEALNRLSCIADCVKIEGPQLIVHLVNWYRYDPNDMTKTMGWNGIEKERDKIALTSKPLFGYYSCDDTHYIDWVLSFSKALGVDELNIDYEGGVGYPEEFSAYYEGRSWDSWFMTLLSRAEKYNVKISVMYEPKSIAWRLSSRQGKGGPIKTNNPAYPREALKILKNDLRKICDKFTVKRGDSNQLIPNPVYKRIAGLPVIWVFHMTAGGLTEGMWKRAVEELRAEGYAFVLVPNTYREEQAGFDSIAQGMNPWLDQLFTGLQNNYPKLWKSAQEAAKVGDSEEAKRIANIYIDEMWNKGVNIVAPVRKVQGPANFNITPLVISFQDAAVDAWGFRPPLYIESYDRTRTEPGRLFRAFFTAAQKSSNQWHMICSGDDIPEQTHMLIPDYEHGFSGPFAISLIATYLGKQPNLRQAFQITEDYVIQVNDGILPEDVQPIFKEAYEVLPGQLKSKNRFKAKKDN